MNFQKYDPHDPRTSKIHETIWEAEHPRTMLTVLQCSASTVPSNKGTSRDLSVPIQNMTRTFAFDKASKVELVFHYCSVAGEEGWDLGGCRTTSVAPSTNP